MTPSEALQKFWGYSSFRPLQREAVEAVLAGRDALVILPTGGGKSVCYQLPAAVGLGMVLVVSPLKALMDDQVQAARGIGLRADALHSGLSGKEKHEVHTRLAKGLVQILYVSPERLLLGDLTEALPKELALIAVDEAHCVSHWGHDFRPEYRRLHEVLETLPQCPRMALTATATADVRDDIASQLPLRNPVNCIGHPDRPNLVYRAFPRREQLPQILDVVGRHSGEGGIVYAQTRKDVERLAEGLKKSGVSVEPYHAGLPDEQRRSTQERFINEDIDVVVATIAFGMGIDRSNVRFVVHANAPRSLEHYQQESGRAGRDGLNAECVLLFAASDLARHWQLSQMNGNIPLELQKSLRRQLKEIGRFASAPVCRHRILSEHFQAEYPSLGNVQGDEGCGACDICLGETKILEDALTTAQKILSAVWRTEGRFGAGYVTNILLGKGDERMARLHHDQLKVFGILRDAGESSVRTWIDQLIVQDFLEVLEEGDYPLLSITEAGRKLCKGEGGVRLAVPIKTAPKGRKPRKLSSLTGGAAPDKDLFEKLRMLRKKLATQSGVPPYVIFHDSALEEMAALKPKTLVEMSVVKGVGKVKLEKFGEEFLGVICGG